jgi:hypothetical protein
VARYDRSYPPAGPVSFADERAILRRRIARQHQVPAAGGVLPAGSRNAEYGLVSLPQLSAHDRDDVAVVSLRGELDSFGASVLQAHLSDIRRQAWALNHWRSQSGNAELLSEHRAIQVRDQGSGLPALSA